MLRFLALIPIGTEKGGYGADGVRTHDLRIANATLSQLSYGPMVSQGTKCPTEKTYFISPWNGSDGKYAYPFFRGSTP